MIWIIGFVIYLILVTFIMAFIHGAAIQERNYREQIEDYCEICKGPHQGYAQEERNDADL